MAPEERFDRIERQVEFLANQQTESAVQISQLGEFLLRTGRLLEGWARRTEEQFGTTNRQLARLTAAQRRTDAQLQRTDERLGQTDERLRRTDERLNALISVVERYLSGNRGSQAS